MIAIQLTVWEGEAASEPGHCHNSKANWVALGWGDVGQETWQQRAA